jgi:hypothetical protein
MDFDTFCKNMIDKFIAERGGNGCYSCDVILEYYATLTIEKAIIEGSNYGLYKYKGEEHTDDHFKHYTKEDLDDACKRLLRVTPKFKMCQGKSFMDVYNIVRGVTDRIVPNLAELYWYDMAIRIAISKEIRLEPEHVFIHRGARWGAESLGVDLRTVTRENPYLPKAVFVRVSKEFDRLKPDEIESMLCIYHSDIKKYFNRL